MYCLCFRGKLVLSMEKYLVAYCLSFVTVFFFFFFFPVGGAGPDFRCHTAVLPHALEFLWANPVPKATS